MDQHTVTRSYIEAFCDPVTPERHAPSVWVTRLQDGSIKRRAPHNVAVEVDYYSRKLPTGETSDGFERVLSRLESEAAPVLRRVRDGHFTLTDVDRERLAIFVSFMMVRVPSFRKYLEGAVNKMAESLMRAAAQSPDYFQQRFLGSAITKHSLTTEQVARMRRLALNAGNPEEGYTIQASPDMSLGYAFEAALAPVPFLLDMGWQFLVSTGNPFITGDTPVTKSNAQLRPPRAAGLAHPHTEVTLPICPSVCLRTWWRRSQPVVEIADDEVARLNRERVRFADREVFASSEVAARAAIDVYAELRQSGEAHAKPISLMLSEGNGPPKPL